MNKLLIILGMMIVTYIPRLIPFITFSNKKLPPKLKQFLEYIPYAALGALIIPGSFNAIPSLPIAGILGLLCAGIYSYIKGGIIISVLGSMAIAYLILVLH